MKKNIIIDNYGIASVLMAVIYCIAAANRGDNIGTDTSTYIYLYNQIKFGEEVNREVEIGFNWLINFFNLFGDVRILFFSIPIFIIILSTNFINTGLNWKFYVSFCCLLLSPFFYGHTLNILRQGLAVSLIIYMLQVGLNRNKTSILIVIGAGLIHNLGFIFGMLAYFSRFMTIKKIIVIWLFFAITGLFLSTNSTILLLPLSYINNDYIAGYFMSDSLDYKFGLRIDFFIFSFVLVGLGLIITRVASGNKNRVISHDSLQYIYKSYLLMNGFGLIFLQMPYADRWLNWSWALIPFFLIAIFDNIPSGINKSFVLLVASIATVVISCSQLGLFNLI